MINFEDATTDAEEERNYRTLKLILDAVYMQVARGKGKERHAIAGKPFEEQSMQKISDMIGTDAGCLHQAIKKIQEAMRMTGKRREDELLGAMAYIAGSILFRQRHDCDESSEGETSDAVRRTTSPSHGLIFPIKGEVDDAALANTIVAWGRQPKVEGQRGEA